MSGESRRVPDHAHAEEGWVAALAAIILLQTISSFLNQMLPTLAPILGAELGWPATMVGYLVALCTAGSILFLTCGNPLVRGVGPIRAVQIGLLLGIVGIALLPAPLAAAPFMAALMIGLAYGPSTPAGSDVLMRYAPARHRSLIFSLKQAGVPLGGAAAGLLLPPLALHVGWRTALLAVVAVLLVAVLLAQMVRRRVDARRAPDQLRLRLFLSPANVRQPFRVLKAPGLQRIAIAGGILGITQGAWNAFLVTYLVGALHLTATQAGMVFAVMQASGVLGRIGLGWLADRIGSGLSVLRLAAAASTLVTLALALAHPDWTLTALIALAFLGGITVSGWNGIQQAEIARRAPPHLVGEASAGGTVFIFLGFVAGPSLFATVLTLTGRFDLACFSIAAMPALAFLLLMRVSHDTPPAL
ncbi:MFS transporter [Aquabacter sp. CN5-332]|uniref:MFS transporter n=1 Tax=Aquabacter sp. CN5-332 TaxID=3156608 RepID=UPI0032B3D808